MTVVTMTTVLRNELVHVNVHHMVDKYSYAGHQEKQNSTLLIKPQCCVTLEFRSSVHQV